MYNLTNLTQANDIYAYTQELNLVSGGYLGVILLIFLYIILFMVFKRFEQDTKSVFMFVSWVMLVIAVLFKITSLISNVVLAYPFIILIAAMIVYKFSD